MRELEKIILMWEKYIIQIKVCLKVYIRSQMIISHVGQCLVNGRPSFSAENAYGLLITARCGFECRAKTNFWHWLIRWDLKINAKSIFLGLGKVWKTQKDNPEIGKGDALDKYRKSKRKITWSTFLVSKERIQLFFFFFFLNLEKRC